MFKIGIKYNQIGLLETYLLQRKRMAPRKDYKPKDSSSSENKKMR